MTQRVRHSPFPDSGGAQGLTQAPTPARPVAAPLSADVKLNWMESDWTESKQPTQPQAMRVTPPMQIPQQPQHQVPRQMPQQVPQQMLHQMPQHGPQHVPQQMQQQVAPQMAQQGMQPCTQPYQHQGQMSAAVLAGGMGAMGVNPMMADVMANGLASQLQSHAVTRWFPTAFFSLQQLFSVGHSFVLRKLLLLMCPFFKRSQGSPSTPWGGEGQDATGSDGLKADIEEADLYIPCMAYVTYVLVYGMQRGVHKDFRPEILSSTFTFALVLCILEVGVFYMAFYFAGKPVSALQLLANCGYKYVPVVLMVLFRILTRGSAIYYLIFAYLAACAAWSIRRFMTHLEPSQFRQQYGVPASTLTTHIITALAAAQIPLCWLLTPSSA